MKETISVEEKVQVYFFSFINVPSSNMEEFMTYAAASHQRAMETSWFYFCNAVMSSIFSLWFAFTDLSTHLQISHTLANLNTDFEMFMIDYAHTGSDVTFADACNLTHAQTLVITH